MIKKPLISIILCLLSTLFAQSRVWTSADGKHTFRGEFVGKSGKFVEIKKGGRLIKSPIEKFSAKDRAWIANNNGTKASAKSYPETNTRTLEFEIEIDTTNREPFLLGYKLSLIHI